MQEQNEKMLKEAATSVDLGSKAGDYSVEKGVFQPSKETRKGVHFPEYWRKKKLNRSLVADLEKTANSEPYAQDEHGEYRLGKFLHSCAIVVVGVVDNLWTLEIHSENPIGLPMIQEIRYKYLPDNLMMAMLFLPRKERTSAKTVVLYQIPGNLKDAGIEEAEG
ncbi:hypothetical protein AALK14_08305 [Butyricimonas hominis]|uniref:hypothetical protein n=1 Tax=Butyricimonas hominis TaxID=2763032 RepID=UPI003514357C